MCTCYRGVFRMPGLCIEMEKKRENVLSHQFNFESQASNLTFMMLSWDRVFCKKKFDSKIFIMVITF